MLPCHTLYKLSSVPVRKIIITREAYLQYPWGYTVHVKKNISTREEDHQYREGMQYPWGKLHFHLNRVSHSWVLMIFLTGTAYILTATDDMPHRYCGYASRMLMIFLTGTVCSHGTEDRLYNRCQVSSLSDRWSTNYYAEKFNHFPLYQMEKWAGGPKEVF